MALAQRSGLLTLADQHLMSPPTDAGANAGRKIDPWSRIGRRSGFHRRHGDAAARREACRTASDPGVLWTRIRGVSSQIGALLATAISAARMPA
ncbi:MAG: hypothetical protein ACJA07_003935 [Rhodococcus sp. (in: high G+C Gram-positive bacteria)]|jgi:hypothetical protein